ncbi:MAG: DUF535 family protein [Burkholderiales bacterium]
MFTDLGPFEIQSVLDWSNFWVAAGSIRATYAEAHRTAASACGAADSLRQLYRLGKSLHPEVTARDLKKRAIILSLWASHHRDICWWFGISDNPLLAQALERFPEMHGAVYWPYVHSAWQVRQRLHAVDGHYRLLGGKAAIVAHAIGRELEIAALGDSTLSLRIVMDKAEWFVREGEVVLNLFLADQRLLSIAFTLGTEGGRRVAYVGAIQGSNAPGTLDVYRKVTHTLHGMRPRDILMAALKLTCAEIAVDRVLAVSDAARVQNSAYFGRGRKDKLLLKYDEVWVEHGGKRLDGGFFEIPLGMRYREPDDVPTRKRAAYRRRYAMLDKLALDVAATCSAFDSSHSLFVAPGIGCEAQ